MDSTQEQQLAAWQKPLREVLAITKGADSASISRTCTSKRFPAAVTLKRVWAGIVSISALRNASQKEWLTASNAFNNLDRKRDIDLKELPTVAMFFGSQDFMYCGFIRSRVF